MTTKTTEEVAVKKIVVQLGKKELVLDIEDAKALKVILNELFGSVVVEKAPAAVEKETIIKEHHYHHDKYVAPYYPSPYFYWNYPAISYTVTGGTTGITCTSGNNYSLSSNGVVNCTLSSSGSITGSSSITGTLPLFDDNDGAAGSAVKK